MLNMRNSKIADPQVLHSRTQDFIYHHPRKLLPYLNTLFEGCAILFAEMEHQLLDGSHLIGSVDVLLTVAYDGRKVRVPIEIKHAQLNGAMKQLRRYQPYIEGCADYGLAVAGSPKNFEVGGVDFRRDHSDYIKL